MAANPALSFLKSPTGLVVKSYVKTFVSLVLAYFLASGAQLSALTGANVKLWVAGAVASLLPSVITYLDKTDPRFGLGKSTPAAVVVTPVVAVPAAPVTPAK